ncbi:MAG: hypothetical protein F9K45_02785 [Melioribacteraceae bacterium]|nr:MAG: hypothetical protein F9K45_02785 [Melioribacteraceae bacterium]
MNRRNFIKSTAAITAAIFLPVKLNAGKIIDLTALKVTEYKKKIIFIIEALKREGSNLVLKIMNGKEYVFNPYTHYPFDGGIKDEESGYRLFFHAHRENEYGHFHTFAKNEDGELIHLILISMNKIGEPIGLATVNGWVTGDKYENSDTLKKLADSFYINPKLYEDEKTIQFINYIFKAYSNEINELFILRDKWIADYVSKNFREPFEDREFEILSYKEITNLL